MSKIKSCTLLLLALLLLPIHIVQAQIDHKLPPTITPLTPMDIRYLDIQRQRIEDLFISHFGQNIRQNHSDLEVMQKLLDKRLIKRNDTLTNQALGIVLGDLIAKELNMKWVVYSDSYGRSRALQLGRSEYFLFPVTMISRRTDADISPDVERLFNKAISTIQPHITKNPYYKPVY
ncbi:uncharacterized protein DUF3806 [Sinobacterium caligoides]|uniref:Uncharacterized protein DUF3806 n=1 Tax=Sinobacterium caligoides TaxID=933926 RepID=A0A3N2DY27_9GAMM|nr:DUF3806 domain-containing protein [Sinobacterium caligoides]ROS04776.1 uncharacterized protein DUF3806 [Sinobacterium caligoides]